jgi:Mrp family chromosome partitioning ATPase
LTNGGGKPRPEFGALVPLPTPSNESSSEALVHERNAGLVRDKDGGRGTTDLAKWVRPMPFAPQPPFDRRLVFTDRDARRASAFRTLRQRLLDAGEIHSILCTSAKSGEGATTCAVNLALSFAELRRYRVLLVEANFRRASLASLFGFVPPAGFRSQIARHRQYPDEPWTMVQIGPPAMFILAVEPHACPRCAAPLPDFARFCGSCGAQVAGTGGMDGAGVNDALASLRQVFDFIIIDGPPVLSSGDVNVIQDSADAIVMAARSGQSDERALARAIEQIAPAPLAGVVLLDA